MASHVRARLGSSPGSSDRTSPAEGEGTARSRFRHVVQEHSHTNVAADVLYWAGVSRYKETDDAEALAESAAALEEKYPGSEAARKGSVWA